MAKLTLGCAIHSCVVQFYLSDLSELVCHMQFRLLVLHSSHSLVLHVSRLCVFYTRVRFHM